MSVPASRVSRVVMTGPLARFAEAYVLELRRRGYTPLTSVNQLRQVGRLSSWLATQGLGVAELNGDGSRSSWLCSGRSGVTVPSGRDRACCA